MTIYAWPGLHSGVNTSEDAGQLTRNTFVTDFADTAQRPATLGIGDDLLIGYIPAGEKFVPNLSEFSIPLMDSAGSPLGDYSLGVGGDSADPDAFVGTAAAETAVVISGEDFILATSEVGNRNVMTPIYLRVLTAWATVASTGKIVCRVVSRPWSRSLDGEGPT